MVGIFKSAEPNFSKIINGKYGRIAVKAINVFLGAISNKFPHHGNIFYFT
jgi:hypothetical protein